MSATLAEQVFKGGFAPQWSAAQLSALAEACRKDDPRLVQDDTTIPPPISVFQDFPCGAGCALGFIGAFSSGGFATGDYSGDYLDSATGNENPDAATVGEVEEFFANACFTADQTLGEPAACRRFLNWFDETDRPEMRQTLYRWCLDVLRDRAAGTLMAVTPYPA